MSGERVYAVDLGCVAPLAPVSLATAGLRERQDLQEWVLARPEILGADVMVVTFEFDRWQDARGDRQRDRLDVLGLDTGGRLVLAELKRDAAPDTVEMQAIKYAAMASRFTEEELVRYHARFLSSRAESLVSEEAARALIQEHAGELDLEVLRQPRIVLVAGSFSPTTSATVVWLNEMGLDITIQRLQAYQHGATVIVTVSQVFPVADVEEFTVSPLRAEVKQAQSRRSGSREASTVVRLVRAKTLNDGTRLTLRPTTDVDADAREAIQDWLDADPRRARATWSNDVRQPLRWEYTGESYRPGKIVAMVLQEAVGIERSMRGPKWWATEDGRTLPEHAASIALSAFDWSELHAVLHSLPESRWTTYGDLAQLVGTAAQPLGQHFMSCPGCVHLWRVLDVNGQVRPGFRWSDPLETRTQRGALEGEGIRFIGERADAASRLSKDELESLRASAAGD
ncbi:alkylated DNA nucleotide flippase Atl1 [Agrococcus sp. UYP33]